MKLKSLFIPVVIVLMTIATVFIISCSESGSKKKNEPYYAGSKSCKRCHEKFFKLWSTSHHGKAMQPITASFIKNNITLNHDEIFMEEAYYKAITIDSTLYIQERKGDKINKFKVVWALGGKNVYYFLTPWEGGRLQTLPIAYKVMEKVWYNNPESAIRHFPDEIVEDEALSWRHRQFTFNTACYTCHVSQLEHNYDLKSNTYNTDWKESGINCETCHGPCSEHIKVCDEAGEGNVPSDLKLISTKNFTAEQHNASCAPCHAKMSAITPSYMPGDKFFDNYNLITIENTDFYPDGRDLGENYTFTSWRMSPCANSGQMHCVTCHTSSGRYRFKSDNQEEANRACLPCHKKNVDNIDKHAHHPKKSNGIKCIDCHMPYTMFGHMGRSDHSMRPPMPSATIKFGSPNACNICHKDKSPQWANKQVRKWHKHDYQKETLYIGSLIKEARNGKWRKLDEMLKVIESGKYGEIFTTSMIRLMAGCTSDKKWETLMKAYNNESPLVRSAAVTALLGYVTQESKNVLIKALSDDLRVVRLSAVASLAVFPQESLSQSERALFNKVSEEYENSLISRPDNWSSHYNLGNHYQNLGSIDKAMRAYETSLKINPEAVMPLINSGFIYSVSGNHAKAEEYMRRAISVEPESEAAYLNLALMMAEQKRIDESKSAFRKVLKINPNNSTAAYNLSIMVSQTDIDEACKLSKQAMESTPEDPKFAYTYAFFLNQNKKTDAAIKVLKKTLKSHPFHANSLFMLANIYNETGKKAKTLNLYKSVLKNKNIPDQLKYQLETAVRQMEAG